VRDKGIAKQFLYRAQKNVAEQKRAEGEARTRFCGARAPEGGEAVTVLLCAVPSTPRYLTTRNFYTIIFYTINLYFYLITAIYLSKTVSGTFIVYSCLLCQ
jgi:hypothetical protein